MPQFTDAVVVANSTLTLNDNSGESTLDFDGPNAVLTIGKEGNEGDIRVNDGAGRRVFDFNGMHAVLKIGSDDNEGDIEVYDNNGMRVFRVNGEHAVLSVGSDSHVGEPGNEGDIIVFDGVGREVFNFNGKHAVLKIGSVGNEGDISVVNNVGAETIQLNGETGDIILRNGDAAEDFDIANPKDAQPGTVMIVEEDKLLHPCTRAYDKRVVGVVAGAGKYRPGVIFDRDNSKPGFRAPISIMGKVSVKADASCYPIEVGSLLTTSDRCGYAQATQDHEASLGSVLGKSLTSLASGIGTVEMLISLR